MYFSVFGLTLPNGAQFFDKKYTLQPMNWPGEQIFVILKDINLIPHGFKDC